MVWRISKNLVLILLLIIATMLFAWFFEPKKVMSVFILDKTVLTNEALEHKCFDWILNHERFVKKNGESYNRSNDYFGFFPKEKFNYEIHDLEKLDDNRIDSLEGKYDLAYFADTYGIYKNEWKTHQNTTEKSGLLYGGMSLKELSLLKKFRARKKLIIAEYNFFASPTEASVRQEFENELKIKWTGWTGRHFENLDTIDNADLPKWVIKNYKRLHNNKWPFKHGGIVFNNANETVEIVEEDTELNYLMPVIYTNPLWQKQYNLPAKTPYTYWFDIIEVENQKNIMAFYQIKTNVKGDSILAKYGIPKRFPAVIKNSDSGDFYYFAGDFCDNPNNYTSSYFAGISKFQSFFYTEEPDDRRVFFWKYYKPLVTGITLNYYYTLKGK